MEYKVAIQFFKEIADAFKCIGNYKGSDVDRKTLAIIDLLEQGEKYKKMWNEIATMYKLPCYGLEGSQVLEIVKFLEQKYSPAKTTVST